MNNTGVTGLTAKKKDFEHARGPHVIPPTQLICHTSDIRHTDNISREISIEHPSVGLASLAQLWPTIPANYGQKSGALGIDVPCTFKKIFYTKNVTFTQANCCFVFNLHSTYNCTN